MSTNKLSQKLLSVLFLVVFFSLLISLFRQIWIYQRISKHLTEEQKELRMLEERNKELKKRLEVIKTNDLPENEEETMEIPNLTEPKTPNYEKWWKLFFY